MKWYKVVVNQHMRGGQRKKTRDVKYLDGVHPFSDTREWTFIGTII
jgi:hypothetical protein